MSGVMGNLLVFAVCFYGGRGDRSSWKENQRIGKAEGMKVSEPIRKRISSRTRA